MSLAIGAYNPAAAAILAATKKAAAQSALQSAATAPSASPAAADSAAGASAPSTVPAADASAAARDTGAASAVQDFLSYANKTPAQRLYDSILKSMGLTEDDVKNMTPAQRAALEKAIEQKIKEAAEEAAQKGKTGVIADVTA